MVTLHDYYNIQLERGKLIYRRKKEEKHVKHGSTMFIDGNWTTRLAFRLVDLKPRACNHRILVEGGGGESGKRKTDEAARLRKCFQASIKWRNWTEITRTTGQISHLFTMRRRFVIRLIIDAARTFDESVEDMDIDSKLCNRCNVIIWK